MDKPKSIYETRYYLIVHYPDFVRKPEEFTVPQNWFNFHNGYEPTQERIEQSVKDIWVDFIEMQSQVTWQSDIYLYVIEFEDEEEFEIAEQALERLYTTGASGISREEFVLLVKALDIMREVQVKKEQYYKNGEKVIFEVDDWLDWGDEDIVEVFTEESYLVHRQKHRMTVDDLRKRNGQVVTVKFETATEKGLPNYEYYDITFNDGLTLTAISGMCLKKIRP